VGDLVATVRSEQLSFLAAAIAYYAFVSIFPLLLVVLAVATAVGGDAFANGVVGRISGVVTPDTTDLLYETITRASARGGATVVGLVVFLWSGLRVFRGLDVAFAAIYGDHEQASLLDQIRDALTVLLGIGLAVLAVVAVGLVAGLSGIQFVGVLAPLALVAGLTLAFLPLYYVFPDHAVTLAEAAPGAVFAAVGWAVLEAVFRLYAANATQFDLYGIVGAVLLLVTWFYFGSLLVLTGAVLNVVLADGDRPAAELVGDRQLQQGPR
jgi:YihY family inner membrane protein